MIVTAAGTYTFFSGKKKLGVFGALKTSKRNCSLRCSLKRNQIGNIEREYSEIVRVTAGVEADPGTFLAYCKGDQNVAADYIRRDSRTRLFDFDSGGFRHALIEGMPGRMTWGRQMRIPGRIRHSMEKAYQSSLALGYAAVADDRLFYRGLVEAGARWNILHLVHRLPDALAGDYQRGLTTLRQQVVAWFKAFADLSEERGQIQALGDSAREVVKRLGEFWPVEVCRLPSYPTFRGCGR